MKIALIGGGSLLLIGLIVWYFFFREEEARPGTASAESGKPSVEDPKIGENPFPKNDPKHNQFEIIRKVVEQGQGSFVYSGRKFDRAGFLLSLSGWNQENPEKQRTMAIHARILVTYATSPKNKQSTGPIRMV